MKTVVLSILLLASASLAALPGADAARIACTSLVGSDPCDGWLCTHWDNEQQRYTRCIENPFVTCVTDPCPPQYPDLEDWLP